MVCETCQAILLMITFSTVKAFYLFFLLKLDSWAKNTATYLYSSAIHIGICARYKHDLSNKRLYGKGGQKAKLLN